MSLIKLMSGNVLLDIFLEVVRGFTNNEKEKNDSFSFVLD